MSKFIRTKEGIEELIYNSEFEYYVTMHTETIISEAHIGMYQTADTIEELCDEFVVIRKIDNLHNLLRNYSIEDLHILKDRQKHNCEVYGAIWTDKGLIYVAKMNEKGELELIWKN